MQLPRFLFPVLAVVAAASARAELPWMNDLDEAKVVAAKEKKAILVDFTGSDWCSWCIRLRKEVFDQKAFEVATKDFIFVELDFPHGVKQAPERKAKNEALAKKFNVQGFPTVLLLNSKGEPFAQTGYQEGGAEAYLKSLATFLKDNTAEGAKKYAAKAEAEAKEAALGEKLDNVIGPLLEKKDVAGAEAALAKFIQDNQLTGETALRLDFNARMGIIINNQPGDHAAALKLVDATLAKGATGDFAEELKGLRERVVKVRDQQAGQKK